MTRAELETYAKTLTQTRLSFARGELDSSGNRIKLVDVPWDVAIVKIIQLTGWRIVEETEDITPTLRLEP